MNVLSYSLFSDKVWGTWSWVEDLQHKGCEIKGKLDSWWEYLGLEWDYFPADVSS